MRTPPRAAWIAIAAAFVVAATMHAVAAVRGEPSVVRHVVFVAINVATAVGVVVRPKGFALAFAALTAQQIDSHGRAAVGAWVTERRIDVPSVLVVVFMPVVLALLVRSKAKRT